MADKWALVKKSMASVDRNNADFYSTSNQNLSSDILLSEFKARVYNYYIKCQVFIVVNIINGVF
jgi:hypothetical protein